MLGAQEGLAGGTGLSWGSAGMVGLVSACGLFPWAAPDTSNRAARLLSQQLKSIAGSRVSRSVRRVLAWQ